MIKKLFMIALMSTLSFAQAQPTIDTVDTDITTSTTWTNDRIYLLKGNRFVKDGATLTIEPGTIIRGDKATKGTLIITRSGLIYANGTPTQPIVFTSNEPAGQRNYGDWGGVVILGSAIINVPGGNAQIEGGLFGPDAEYGGSYDDDSSGVFRYVRIEYPGIAYQPNSEINGLTMGGVGRRTIIEYVQVSYSGDDSYEWFGGTVNCKYLIAHRGWDDDFDTDFGYTGKVQFALSMRDPNIADQSQSNGFESDNDGTGTTNTPITAPVFSNVTIIGPKENGTPAALYRRALHLRRNTRTSIYNSVFMGYTTGLHIDGTAAQSNATNDSLQIERVVFANMTNNFEQSQGANSWAGMETYFTNSVRGNVTYDSTHQIGLSSGYNSLTNPQLLLQPTSILKNGASFTIPRLSNPFFTPVTHIGAFGDSSDWTSGWSNFMPDTIPTSVEFVTSPQMKIYPNPSNGKFTISSDEPILDIMVYNVMGQPLNSVWDELQSTLTINGGGSGVLLVRITTTSGTYTKRIINQ
jgi:hypothetical protein